MKNRKIVTVIGMIILLSGCSRANTNVLSIQETIGTQDIREDEQKNTEIDTSSIDTSGTDTPVIINPDEEGLRADEEKNKLNNYKYNKKNEVDEWGSGLPDRYITSVELLEWSYKTATDEQRKKLDNINNDLGNVGIYRKQIMIIMNLLDEDTPNLTLEQVNEICNTYKEKTYTDLGERVYEMRKEFDKIAGAADFDGGSGISRIIYFIGEDHTKYIEIFNDWWIEYVDTINETKERIFKE